MTIDKTFITDSDYKFTWVKKTTDNNLNWVFLPGGPGLGSEYFELYLKELKLPGTIWRLDFPGDGSNRNNENVDYDSWDKTLVLALRKLEHVILVTHSFSGMLALTVPDLENSLSGLVIMNAAPNKDWRVGVEERAKKCHIKDISYFREIYNKDKNNENFKQLTLASWQYFMSAKVEGQAKNILSILPYNYRAFEWADQNFHPFYNAKWVPQLLPTLILGGSDDVLTPIQLFVDDKRFHRKNILLREIKHASHFPYMEQPLQVESELQNFYEKLTKYKDKKESSL